MSENTNDSANPVLTFEGKKYLINELSNEIKESIKVLQIAETQLKMHQDTLKLLSISRNTLANQLRDKLKNLAWNSNNYGFLVESMRQFYYIAKLWLL